jgi:hypothetical protein
MLYLLIFHFLCQVRYTIKLDFGLLLEERAFLDLEQSTEQHPFDSPEHTHQTATEYFHLTLGIKTKNNAYISIATKLCNDICYLIGLCKVTCHSNSIPIHFIYV